MFNFSLGPIGTMGTGGATCGAGLVGGGGRPLGVSTRGTVRAGGTVLTGPSGARGQPDKADAVLNMIDL